MKLPNLDLAEWALLVTLVLVIVTVIRVEIC